MNSNDLLADETIVYEGKLHWGLFVLPALILIAALGAAGPLTLAHHGPIAAVICGVALIFFLPSLIRYQTNGLTLTNRRVISRSGAASRRSIDIALSKIEGVSVDQDMFGQVFNYGTLVVRGTGGGIEKFQKLSSPGNFSKYLHQQISR
jgi:uncharacterized membrane protein YdbT with pleckstrin-like domain